MDWIVVRGEKTGDDIEWSKAGFHATEIAACRQARDLYDRGAYSVKVIGPDGFESDKWASSGS